MKYLAFIVLLGASCFGAVAHVQSNQGFCGSAATGGNITTTCSALTSKAFSFTATNTNDAVLIFVGCGGTTETTVSLAATGWVFTKLSGPDGASGSFAGAFWAVAPNTSAATITMTWSGGCGSFMNDLIDEFSGNDTTTPVDASSKSSGTATNCGGTGVANVTPTVANDGLWGACNDSVTAVGGGFTSGANDTQQDLSEWKILSGGSGVAQGFTYTGASGAYVLETVAIKPAGGAAAPSGFNKRQKIEQLERGL